MFKSRINCIFNTARSDDLLIQLRIHTGQAWRQRPPHTSYPSVRSCCDEFSVYILAEALACPASLSDSFNRYMIVYEFDKKTQLYLSLKSSIYNMYSICFFSFLERYIKRKI